MHILSQEKFQRDAEPELRLVFIRNNDTEPFRSQVEERLFLYFPIGGDSERNYHWQRQLFEAIADAASKVGDTGCYLAPAWEGDPIITTGGSRLNRFAYISQPELVEAFAAPYGNPRIWSQLNMSGLDFCLFSESGKWGLLTTIDDHAFLGGSSEFMQTIKNYFPYIQQEVHEYLHNLKLEQLDGEKIDIPWLKKVLTHVYGAEVAKQMLIDSNLIST